MAILQKHSKHFYLKRVIHQSLNDCFVQRSRKKVLSVKKKHLIYFNVFYLHPIDLMSNASYTEKTTTNDS